MTWTLNKNGVTPSVKLESAEQAKLNEFMGGVQKGKHPKEAAAGSGFDYKKLTGDQYQIRLSKAQRATFLVDDKNQVVKMLQVGGHT